MFTEIGIKNVAKRIEYMFGENYGLTLQSEKGLYTKAIIRLPLQKKDGTAWRPN